MSLKKSYDEYRSKGFILNKSLRFKKFSSKKGEYSKRENEPFNEKATGYVAIIPPEIIIVDNDSYAEGNEFKKFIDDLGYAPIPFAVTPSGGEHYAFKNPYPEKVCGKSEYKKVDIFAGYQSVIPIVGTQVRNKQGEIKTYEWHPDNFEEEIILNEIPEDKIEIFNLRDKNEGVGYTEADDDFEEMVNRNEKETYTPKEEVEAILNALPENMEYDDWLKVGMMLYDRFNGSDEGKELWLKYSQKSAEKFDEDYTLKKWEQGHLKGDSISYRSLPHVAAQFCKDEYFDHLLSSVDTADTEEKIDGILQKVKVLGREIEDKKIDLMAEKLNKAYKKVKAPLSGRQARTLKKEIKKGLKRHIEKEIEESNISVYRLVNRYIVQVGEKLIQDVSSTMLKEILATEGLTFYDNDSFFAFKTTIPNISAYTTEPDYTLRVPYTIELIDNNNGEFPKLVKKQNPLIVSETEIDEDIVDEFFNGVWAGKICDIVKLIALSIKTKETKLNRLMVVAPSNAGKTEIFTMLGFQKITMKRLLLAMRGDKGVGKQVVDGIEKTGLLLIDEANKALEAEIKDMDKELHIDQFGANGGTRILRLHFTALTSTHTTATRNNSDELYNRFLQVELTRSEMKHTITEGRLFKENSERYTETIRAKLIQLFYEYLNNQEGKEELRELQEKYRLPQDNDLEELLYEISCDFIEDTKIQARDHGDVVYKAGSYLWKRKTDIRSYFENRLNEIDGIDVGKYADLLMSHFVKNNSKSIKIDGKPTKYYEIETIPFRLTHSEKDKIVDMFDDLSFDEDDF